MGFTQFKWEQLADTIAGRGCPSRDEGIIYLWGQLAACWRSRSRWSCIPTFSFLSHLTDFRKARMIDYSLTQSHFGTKLVLHQRD